MRLKTSSAGDSVNYRYSGILVHPTSFPSPYGIGDFGKGAYDFIDFLEASGQHLWQILPLNPITSYGNSPYQGFSVFAGEPLLLSPQLLKEQGLLAEEDLRVIPDFDPVRVDYEAVRAYKYPLYRKAYQNFLEGGGTALQEVYDDFCARNEDWLSDYCLYMAIKDEQEGLPWTKWPEALRNLSEKDRAFWTQKLEKEIGYYAFLQFCFRFFTNGERFPLLVYALFYEPIALYPHTVERTATTPRLLRLALVIFRNKTVFLRVMQRKRPKREFPRRKPAHELAFVGDFAYFAFLFKDEQPRHAVFFGRQLLELSVFVFPPARKIRGQPDIVSELLGEREIVGQYEIGPYKHKRRAFGYEPQ